MDLRYDEIHVIWRRDIHHWCARGLVGDWGISKDRSLAISMAVDAVVSAGRYTKVVVYTKRNRREFVITKFRKMTPSPQFFQDAVP